MSLNVSMTRTSFNSRIEFLLNHWDTQVVHFPPKVHSSSVQIIIQSSEDNPVLGNTLVSVSDGTVLLSFYCDRNCE